MPISGDINDDNQVNVLDYNLMISCFGDIELPDRCYDENFNIFGDINDDYYVLEDDYNLFIRQLVALYKQ